MRLKGGKLLLDLSKFQLPMDEPYQLTNEETKAILEKGLCVLCILSGKKITIDIIWNETDTGVFFERNFFVDDGVTYDLSLNPTTNELIISEQ